MLKLKSWREYWGASYFVLVSVLAFCKLMTSGNSGHYDFFRATALKIWSGENPYAIPYPSGYFLYSPSCALFFYGLVAWLPYFVGLALYMGASWLLLRFALKEFLGGVGLAKADLNLFYFILSSEVIGTLLNARIEIFILGIVLLAGTWIFQQRREGLAYFLLAMICNFKMQSLPTVGLLLVVDLVGRRRLRPTFYFAASLLFWYLVPFAVRPSALLVDSYRTWISFFGPYVRAGWMDFQHIYRFIFKISGAQPSFDFGQKISALCGALFAVVLGWRVWRDLRVQRTLRADSSVPVDLLRDWNLRALALGAAFVCLFSPMGQSAAFTLYAPLLLCIFVLRARGSLLRRWLWNTLLVVAFFFISLAYSDLTPRSFRIVFFDYSVKAFGISILSLALLAETHFCQKK